MKGIRIGIGALGILLLLFLLIKRPINVPVKTSANQEKVVIPENPFLVDFLDSLDQRIKLYLEEKKVPGVAVVVVHQGKTVYKKAFGIKVKNSVSPIDTNTVFRIASVSKGFSAAIAGILVNDSLLKWDDKVKDHLPSFALKSDKQSQEVEIKHILSHTSGLQYQAYTNLVEEGWPRDKIIAQLRDVDLISKAGKLYSYQNVAYSIIEPIIENITNSTFKVVLETRLFTPLGMKDASVSYEDFEDEFNKAKPHLYRGNGHYKEISISPTYYNVAAAGGINASISDMEDWLLAMLGHKTEVIPAEVLNVLFTPLVRTSLKEPAFRRITRSAKAFYGLGWRIVHLPNDTLVYHGGYANGYRSGISFSPKYDIGICILTNSSYDLPGETMADFYDLFYPQADSIKSWRYENYF